ncbi:DUF4395 domain-containing protein [Paenibacillus mesotrionivorans]|uniref:DUF4395 domain-containing protein n=1 Tax=Paenibacillus mesotrionivorans TaxID=3160968 RepID=A0ACC7NW39_9BACL
MKEIPIEYVKANQSGIVLSVIAFLVSGQPWIIAALWLIQVIGLFIGGRWNLFAALGRLFLTPKGKETQAAELLRFNNSLAVAFLSLSLVSLLLGWTTAGYVFAAMLLGAAGAALLGYCVGCTLYFWVKQIRAGR